MTPFVRASRRVQSSWWSWGGTWWRRPVGLVQVTELLRHRHRRPDADGLSAFLYAGCARTRDRCLRNGYAEFGAPFRLPGGPPMWPMWRTAG